MYKVFFQNIALRRIRKYTQAYKAYFRNLYEDTGLWNEDMIIDAYMKKAEQIAEGMISLIEKKFSQEIIFWRISDTTHILLYENKVLVVTYREDSDEQIRFIEDIIIAERR